MPRSLSPDLRSWVDLSLYDVTLSDLLNRALSDAVLKLPGWVPRRGHTEMVLLEAFALEVAEQVYAINRVPSAIAQIQGFMAGVDRNPGVQPTSTATFSMLDATGYTIPAGTRLRLIPGADDPMVFTTSAALVVAPGSTTGTVAIIGAEPSSRVNGTAAGTALDLLDSISTVNSVALGSVVGAGADPEDVQDWLTRTLQRYSRLSEVLVLPAHFVSRALEDVRVFRALGLNLYDPAVGPVGSNPGHMTVAVSGSGGALLSSGIKAELTATLDGAALANLSVHVVDVTLNSVDVDVTVLRTAAVTSAAVTTAITAALSAYLSPDSWQWGGTVYRNELISLIDGVFGVERVVAITTPAADLVLTGVAPLTTAGAITVTVQAP